MNKLPKVLLDEIDDFARGSQKTWKRKFNKVIDVIDQVEAGRLKISHICRLHIPSLVAFRYMLFDNAAFFRYGLQDDSVEYNIEYNQQLRRSIEHFTFSHLIIFKK